MSSGWHYWCVRPDVKWTNIVAREIPPPTRWVKIRVRVRLHAPNRRPVPVLVRAFAFDRYPARGEAPTNESEREAWVAVDHGPSGASDWIDLGCLEVARDTKDRCRFCVGWSFDPTSNRDPEATTFSVVALEIATT